MGNVKKSIAERTRHQRHYDRRVNKRHIQTQEIKIDTGKTIDDDLAITKSSGTKSEVQDDSSGSGNDTDADNADTRQLTTQNNHSSLKIFYSKRPLPNFKKIFQEWKHIVLLSNSNIKIKLSNQGNMVKF
ncbi:hypothetical protein Tco_0306847 [Tanacetum coccineum]